MSGLFVNLNTIEAKIQSIEQTKQKKKYSKKKDTQQLSSFGKAYRDARKKGLKTFTYNGKTYTTEKQGTTNNNTKNVNTKNTSASYNNVSFSSAYRDARKKGYSTFEWKGKLYSSDIGTKTSNKNKTTTKTNVKKKTTQTYTGSFSSAYRDAKKKGYSTFKWKGKTYTTGKTYTKGKTKYTKNKSKYTKKKKYTTKKKYTKKKKYKTKTYYPPTNSYTPPKNYDSDDNNGREFKRRESNESFRKEPKKEGD